MELAHYADSLAARVGASVSLGKKLGMFTDRTQIEQVTTFANEIESLQDEIKLAIEEHTKQHTESQARNAAETAASNKAKAYEQELRDTLEESKSECTAANEQAIQTESEIRAAMTACATAIDKLSERRNAVFLAQGSSLLQLHRSLSGDHLRDELTDELFTVAKRYSSPAISNIAMQIKSGGPFDKVKEMIENLITSLQGQVRRK